MGGFGFACGAQNKAKQDFPHTNSIQTAESAININTASVDDLEKLPNIGNQRAREIVQHREKFGKFRKAEHLLMVRGISDELFRKIRPLIKVE